LQIKFNLHLFNKKINFSKKLINFSPKLFINMNTIVKYGHFLIAIPIAVFGMFHFLIAQNMVGMVPSWLPGGVFWVYLTGIAHLSAAVAVIIGKHTRLAATLLGVMLIVFALTVYLPKVTEGDQMAMFQVLKDLVMAGGCWVYASTQPKE
jgi:putative oxidoreductase